MSISAWDWHDVRLPSPDGTLVATVTELTEIGTGGPMRGVLRLSNGMHREGCGASIVWSDDSKHLAVPEWTPGGTLRLVILSVARHEARVAPSHAGLVELARFSGGIVDGFDGRRPASVDVRRIVW